MNIFLRMIMKHCIIFQIQYKNKNLYIYINGSSDYLNLSTSL